MNGMTDRAGFPRRFGIYVFRQPRHAPFVSFGVHIDWHTPTLDVYFLVWALQIGRNIWQPEGRFHYLSGGVGSGHTSQCMCDRNAIAATKQEQG